MVVAYRNDIIRFEEKKIDDNQPEGLKVFCDLFSDSL